MSPRRRRRPRTDIGTLVAWHAALGEGSVLMSGREVHLRAADVVPGRRLLIGSRLVFHYCPESNRALEAEVI